MNGYNCCCVLKEMRVVVRSNVSREAWGICLFKYLGSHNFRIGCGHSAVDIQHPLRSEWISWNQVVCRIAAVRWQMHIWGDIELVFTLALWNVMPIHIDRLLEDRIHLSSSIECHRMKLNLSSVAHSVALADLPTCFLIKLRYHGTTWY